MSSIKWMKNTLKLCSIMLQNGVKDDGFVGARISNIEVRSPFLKLYDLL